MNYKNYSADDLIKDEFFQQWVFSPTEDTNRFWLTFLQEYPDRRDRVEEARQFLSAFNVKDKDVFEAKIGNLKKRIDHVIDHPEHIPHQPAPPAVRILPKQSRRMLLVKIAASVSIIFLTAFLIYYYYVYSSSRDEQIAASVPMQEQVTPKGKRTVVALADGSQVWLNADSRLEYPENFNDRPNREVYLEGEAFFEITENKKKPFLVNTASITIKALGTTLNVKSYTGDERIETTLVNGTATLESKDRKLRQITLAPKQKAIFEKGSGKLILENQADTEKSIAWKNGLLVFDHQPFSEINEILERWYDVTFHVSDESTMSCRFSAHIDNKTLEEALALLFKNSGAVPYRIEDKEIFITGKPCQE